MLERDLAQVGTMSFQLAKAIGTRIVGGEFRPGDVLPVESELCRAYGVSRTTVREAVKNLAAKRLIDVAPKTGTRVRAFAEWNLLDPDVLSWRLNAQFDAKIVEDFYEMRLCFEPRASFLAARDGAAEDHRAIERRFTALAVAGDESRLAAEADLQFHLAVIAASRNGMFVTIGGAIRTALRVASERLQRRGVKPKNDVELHEAVLRAIVARRPDDASEAMVRLLSASKASLFQTLAAHRPAPSS